MGLRDWARRRQRRQRDKLLARVAQHVPVQPSAQPHDAPPGPLTCRACKHAFDGADEDLHRHQILVAYKLGRRDAGDGFVG